MSYQDAGMGRDSKSTGGKDLDVRFRKLPEYGRRNDLGDNGGREIAVEVVGKGGGRDGGGKSRFHFVMGSDVHVSRPLTETIKSIIYIQRSTRKLRNYMELLQL